MSSIDFAAAQQRVLARQQANLQASRDLLDQRQAAHAANPISKLPYPIGSVAQKSLTIWDKISGREGTKPLFRVGQVDAELLDEELLELLGGQVGEGLKYFGSHVRDDWSSEIQLLLRAVLFKLSIWDHNASYGAALQNLQYTDARSTSRALVAPSRWQKSIHGIWTVLGRYGWGRWEEYLIDHERESSRRMRLLSRISDLASTTYSALAFISFLVFLINGRYRTLLDRVLRMRLAAPSHQLSRQISFEYLNRQLVWHAFTEFVLFLLPLVGISRWKRWLARAWHKAKKLATSSSSDEASQEEKKGELAFLPERTCGICYKDQNMDSADADSVAGASGGVVGSAQTDITNPYETIPCGCLYCYVCIATRLEAEEGEGWICLRCGELVKECKPWSGDVVEDVLQEEVSVEEEKKHHERYDDSGIDQSTTNSEDRKAHDHQSILRANGEYSPKKMESHSEVSDSGVDVDHG